MRERGHGDTARASEIGNTRSELPALLLPQPRPPRIDDPDCGKALVVEPVDRPQRPEEAKGKPDPDNAKPHAGGQSA